MTETICPHCGHKRSANETTTPEWECPACRRKYYEAKTAKPGSAHTASGPMPRLTSCLCCGKAMSRSASCCPHCGEPNPEAPKTAGIIASLIAICLGVGAATMPYFATVFLTPATICAALVAMVLRERWMAGIALMLAAVGLFGIYETSQEIKRSTAAAQQQAEQVINAARQAQRKLDADLEAARQESERLQRQLRNY